MTSPPTSAAAQLCIDPLAGVGVEVEGPDFCTGEQVERVLLTVLADLIHCAIGDTVDAGGTD